jgi:hypothetical protein
MQDSRVEAVFGIRDYFEAGNEDQGTLPALRLRRFRQRSGSRLSQVSQRLGVASINAYARHEQGRSFHAGEDDFGVDCAVSSVRDFVVVVTKT